MYSLDEVIVLVEEYIELDSARHKSWIHIRLIDLERVLGRLSRPYVEAIFLCGLMALSLREAAEYAGVSHTIMWRRYNRGLLRLVTLLNGG